MALVEGVQLRIKIDGDKVAVKGLNRVRDTQQDVESSAQGAQQSASRMSKTLGDEVAPAADKATDSTTKMGGAMKGGAENVKMMATRLIGVVAALGLGQQAFQRTIGRALDFDRALIEVQRKTGTTTEEANRLGGALLDLSGKLAIPQEELAAIAATAGQLGIEGVENITEFTEVVAQFGEATELTSDEASQALATIGNAFNLPISESQNLASAINSLANTTAASARPIVSALERVGGAGSSAGFTADQVAGLSATLIDAGIEASTAGTSLRNLFVNLQTEADELASVAGMASDEFKTLVEEDALSALNAYLDGLREMPSSLQAINIREAFGRENFLAVQTLASQHDNLNENLARSAEEYEKATAVTEEFETGIDRASRQIEIFTARLTAAGTEMGRGFLRGLGEALGAINRIGESADQAAGRIDRLRREQGNLREARDLVSTYRTLSDVTDRTTEEQEQLRSVVEQLRSRFPGFVSSVQDASGSFRVYADAIGDVISARGDQALREQVDAASGIVQEFEQAVRLTRQYEQAQVLLADALGASSEEQQQIARDIARLGPGFGELVRLVQRGGDSEIRQEIERIGQSASEAATDLEVAGGALTEIFTIEGELQSQQLMQLFEDAARSPEFAQFAFSDFVDQMGDGQVVTFGGEGEDVQVDTSPISQLPPAPMPVAPDPVDELIVFDPIDMDPILDAGLLDTIGEMELRILRIDRAQEGGLLTDTEADARRLRAAEQALQSLQQQAEAGRDVSSRDVRGARQVIEENNREIERGSSSALASGLRRGAQRGFITGMQPILQDIENDTARALISAITQALASAAATRLADLLSGGEPRDVSGDLLGSLGGGLIGAGLSVLTGGFAEGGYTGHGSRMEVAGTVHRGEYVIPKPVVDRTGPEFWARMAGMPGYATGGFVRPVKQSDGGSDALMREVRGLADEVARMKQEPAPTIVTRQNSRQIGDEARRYEKRRRPSPPSPNR